MAEEKITCRRLLQSGAATAAVMAAAPLMLSATAAESTSSKSTPNESPDTLLATLWPEHPRLLATAATWRAIRARRDEDALLDAFLRHGEAEARALLAAAPMIYKKDGKRLLHVSRVVLRRVLLLSLHYHLTGDVALARRAEAEMLAVAAFSDWNPSHFLDVGEMTAALAFGYDWLYDQLGAESRPTIATAIVQKGLQPGLTSNGWTRSENNWNSVCLSGLTLGALALADSEPELAAKVLQQTKTYNANGLKPYAPDGVYPEGAMYWGYGTTFQVVLLDALQSALGTDWGLSHSPGFMASAGALFQQLGPGGTFFNFSDNVERPGTEPAMWWLARELKQPALLRYDLEMMEKYAAAMRTSPETANDRLLPLAALWWPDTSAATIANTAPGVPLHWQGHGPNPLAVFRGAWHDPQTMYLALKGGSASVSHGHMDAGSFVFEANGVRWARDLGMQDYLSLESKSVDLWRGGQNDGRWKVFRLNNFSHNTLTINSQLHRVDGHAAITHFADSGDLGAIIDLSPVFKGQAGKVTRSFAFRPDRHLLLRDEIEGLQPGDTVRWAMLTKAEIELSAADGTAAILRENGQQLQVRLQASVPARFEAIPAAPPENDYDAPNPGFRLLIVHLTAPASGRLDWSVILQPQPGATA